MELPCDVIRYKDDIAMHPDGIVEGDFVVLKTPVPKGYIFNTNTLVSNHIPYIQALPFMHLKYCIDGKDAAFARALVTHATAARVRQTPIKYAPSTCRAFPSTMRAIQVCSCVLIETAPPIHDAVHSTGRQYVPGHADWNA